MFDIGKNVWYTVKSKGGGRHMSRLKGLIGELSVRFAIGKTKKGRQYVINNYMFLCGGKSVQIDHIVVNKNGVFVIETKNYSGKIYGTDRQRQWLQVSGKGKTQIYSPVLQNASHIYRLEQTLPINVYLTSLVVFVQNNTENITSDNVIPIKILKQRLRLPGKIKPYTAEQMEQIFSALKRTRNTEITEKEHISRINEAGELIRHNLCPVCGRPLVTRTSEHGDFLACSGYPECKFIKRG